MTRGHRLPRVACRLPRVACHLPRVACHLPCVACHLPRVACHLPRVACHMPCVACRLPLVACCLPRVTCHVPRVACRLSCAACCTLRVAYHMPRVTCRALCVAGPLPGKLVPVGTTAVPMWVALALMGPTCVYLSCGVRGRIVSQPKAANANANATSSLLSLHSVVMALSDARYVQTRGLPCGRKLNSVLGGTN